MTLLKQAMAVLGTVLAITVLVAIISPKTAQAVAAAFVQIQPGTTTLVGQNEGELVSLYCQPTEAYCVTNSPSGTLSTSAYVVPSGYTLVITDWEYFSGSGVLDPGDFGFDYLQPEPIQSNVVLAVSTSLADGIGRFAAHEKYITGIRAGSGTTISDSLANTGNGAARIQGYLVPN